MINRAVIQCFKSRIEICLTRPYKHAGYSIKHFKI